MIKIYNKAYVSAVSEFIAKGKRNNEKILNITKSLIGKVEFYVLKYNIIQKSSFTLPLKV
jgi:hypothetical protein